VRSRAWPEISATTFSTVLEWLYTGTCEVSGDLLLGLLNAANYLDIGSLKQAAEAALMERLCPENTLSMWAAGEECTAPTLAAAAKEMALSRFEELGESLAMAPLEHVRALIADDELQVVSGEEAVFSAVVRLVEATQLPEASTFELLEHVRFCCMRREFIDGTVRKWPPLATSVGMTFLLDQLVPFVGRPALPPRQRQAQTLYVLGGGDDSSKSVLVFDTKSTTCKDGVEMGTARFLPAAAALAGKVYVVGGNHFGKTNAAITAEVLDPQSGRWSAVAPMHTAREWSAAGALQGRLYAIGSSKERDSQSVEAFDPHTNTWAVVAPMLTGRAAAAAAVLGDQLYVAGGRAKSGAASSVLSTVEFYDPTSNSWAPAVPMHGQRSFFGMAALCAKLYAAGGADGDDNAQRSVEAFDPKTNTWTTVAPMNTARKEFSLTAAQGKLYAIGGRPWTLSAPPHRVRRTILCMTGGRSSRKGHRQHKALIYEGA